MIQSIAPVIVTAPVVIEVALPEIIAGVLVAITVTDIIINRRGNTDLLRVPDITKTNIDKNGNCRRPTQYKWKDSGDKHGARSGYHWHWIEYHLADPVLCVWFSKRGAGPEDPGAGFVLLPGTSSTTRRPDPW
jgi:hypothetical protein